MFWGILSLFGCGYNVAKEKYQQNKPYYGTDRELFRNNPAVQKKDLGTRRLGEDLQNGVPSHERNRRRMLGYYDGEDVDITDTTKDPNEDFLKALFEKAYGEKK